MTLALSALLDALSAAPPDAALDIALPEGVTIAAHFHVTEVGRVRKDFIDCGGTVRSWERCVVQVWVAEDRAHRVSPGKLAKILRSASPIFGGGSDPEVEVEYDVGVITQFPLVAVETTPAGIVLRLDGKHTACLAPDDCGVVDSACAAPGCCAPAVVNSPALTIGVPK